VSEQTYRLDGGAVASGLFSLTVVRSLDGSAHTLIAQVVDITGRKSAEAALAASEQRFRVLSEAAPFGVFAADAFGRRTFTNQRWREILGMAEENSLGLSWVDTIHDEDAKMVIDRWMAAGEHRQLFDEVFRVVKPGGDTRWVRCCALMDHDRDEWVGTVEDVTEARQLQDELAHHADHDPLTGLLNRRAFDSAMVTQQRLASRYGHDGVLLLIDLNGFKAVNDRHGHVAGDELLVGIAAALCRRLRQEDTIARIGGDEFAAIIPSATTQDALQVAEDLRHVIADVSIGGGVGVTASIGLGHFTSSSDSRSVLADADRAMYEDKEILKAGPVPTPPLNGP
jgi:diguanylate cyclase (GGDEF)-like protein/PAS domain S-box-containing protein